MIRTAVQVQTLGGGLEKLREMKAALEGTGTDVRLFRGDFVPSVESTEADFEAAEVDFDTYAAAAVVYGDAGIDEQGRPILGATPLTFQNVDGTAATPGGDQIGGIWLRTHQTGPPLVNAVTGYFVFDVPIDLSRALALMTVDVVQVQPNGETYVIVET